MAKYNIISSETYYISPMLLRDLGLESHQRNRNTAYENLDEYKHMTKKEREQIYDQLKEQIKTQGFKNDYPIIIFLLRKEGKKDMIFQGHHRLNIAIELGISRVPVRFAYKERNWSDGKRN